METAYAEYKKAFDALTLNMSPEDKEVIADYVSASHRYGIKGGFIQGYETGRRHARQGFPAEIDADRIDAYESDAELYFRKAFESDE